MFEKYTVGIFVIFLHIFVTFFHLHKFITCAHLKFEIIGIPTWQQLGNFWPNFYYLGSSDLFFWTTLLAQEGCEAVKKIANRFLLNSP